MRRTILTVSTLTAVSFLSPSMATGTSAQSFSSEALVELPTDGWRPATDSGEGSSAA